MQLFIRQYLFRVCLIYFLAFEEKSWRRFKVNYKKSLFTTEENGLRDINPENRPRKNHRKIDLWNMISKNDPNLHDCEK